MKRKMTVRPGMGLAVLLLVLLSAAACWAVPRVMTDDSQKLRKKDEIHFLDTAVSLSIGYSGDMTSEIPYNNNLATNIQQNGGSVQLLLVNPDGELTTNQGAPYYSFSQNRLFLTWRGGTAYLVYNNFPDMTQKFEIYTYDDAHYTGNAIPSGTLGKAFDGVPATFGELSSEDRKDMGWMRLFHTRNSIGAEIYLIELVVSDYNVHAVEDFSPVYHDRWPSEVKNALRIAFPALLALYWLLLPLWIVLDARRCRLPVQGWVAAAFFLNVLVLPAYLIWRSRKAGALHRRACPRCSGLIRPEHRFCPACGAPLRAKCPACGREQGAGWTVCPWCDGKAAAAGAGAEAPQATGGPAEPAAPETTWIDEDVEPVLPSMLAQRNDADL